MLKDVTLIQRVQTRSLKSGLLIEVILPKRGQTCSKRSGLIIPILAYGGQTCSQQLNLLTAIKLACRNLTCLWILDFLKEVKLFYNPNSHPNGFYWRHQHSCTLTPANSMQVPNMLSDDCNRR